MRTASGTEKTLLAACTSRPTAARVTDAASGPGVRFLLLMQELYGWHFLAAFRGFDAVPDQDQPVVDPHDAWEQLHPASRHKAESRSKAVNAAAVKK